VVVAREREESLEHRPSIDRVGREGRREAVDEGELLAGVQMPQPPLA